MTAEDFTSRSRSSCCTAPVRQGDKQLTATEWIKVRDHVAVTSRGFGGLLSPVTQADLSAAERLLSAGIIDIDAVLAVLIPNPPQEAQHDNDTF